jgi:hypothetical protein
MIVMRFESKYIYWQYYTVIKCFENLLSRRLQGGRFVPFFVPGQGGIKTIPFWGMT